MILLMQNKLIVCIMGQNCDNFIRMCLESVKDADAIVYCSGGNSIKNSENDFTIENDSSAITVMKLMQVSKVKDIKFILNPYDQNDKQMNGKQRNFYLEYLKQNYPNDWALCLDADEVVEDLSHIKKFIQGAPEGLYSVKMRHFQQDLGHEDATVQIHMVPHRLFKISEADSYPLSEHPVLQPIYKDQSISADRLKGANYQCQLYGKGDKTAIVGQTICSTIWHLAYIPNLWDIKKRYDSHMRKSEMHTPEYLHNWYRQHLFGTYPKSQINLTDIPEVILNEFGIDKDEMYFANRGLEVKHFLMTKQWNDFFEPKSVLDLGCGRGPYMIGWKQFVKEVQGLELSKYAVKNALTNGIHHGDITNFEANADLITAIDVLEHLDNNELDKAMKNIVNSGRKFLFSVPVIGDPNLMNDNTHKQFRERSDWIELFKSYRITMLETPKEWLYSNQLFVGVKL